MTNLLKEWWLGTPTSDCTDSLASRLHLLRQIESKWGKTAAVRTDLDEDVMNSVRWHFAGFKVKLKEEPLRGIRLVPPRKLGTRMTIYKPQPVKVFHRFQVEAR